MKTNPTVPRNPSASLIIVLLAVILAFTPSAVKGQSEQVPAAAGLTSQPPRGAGTWVRAGRMVDRRGGHFASLLLNGQVLIVGGANNDESNLSSAELFNPTAKTWTLTGSLNLPRLNDAATLLPSGQVLVAGGLYNASFQQSAELYDPTTGLWTYTADLLKPRADHTATTLLSGKVLVAGGLTARI